MENYKKKILSSETFYNHSFLNIDFELTKFNYFALKEYFKTPTLHYYVTQSLKVSNAFGEYDVKVNVAGGGITGQAQAIRLAIAKALVEMNAELKKDLRAAGLITRDPRMVERKKFGQKKARARFQFSKR